jgi:hypothetical protein
LRDDLTTPLSHFHVAGALGVVNALFVFRFLHETNSNPKAVHQFEHVRDRISVSAASRRHYYIHLE